MINTETDVENLIEEWISGNLELRIKSDNKIVLGYNKRKYFYPHGYWITDFVEISSAELPKGE